MHTDIRALSGIRTHDPSVRADEGSSCLRTRGYCDRLFIIAAQSIRTQVFEISSNSTLRDFETRIVEWHTRILKDPVCNIGRYFMCRTVL
jgi:hypothetical protein